MELFKLFGSIMVDNSKANESISSTDGKAKGLMSSLGGGIKTVAKWGTAIVGAAVAGGAALFGMANKAAGTTDRIDKLSQKIGMSRTGFQEWEFICSQSGMSVEKLQGGLKTLNTRMAESQKGTGAGAEAFAKLKISATDTTGALKTQEQVFEETVIALQKMPDGAEKARLANELFGKSGQELMPLLNGAAGSVEELKNKAHELGLVINDESIDAGVKFTDTVDQLKRSFGAAVTQIGIKVMPAMQKFADWIIANMPTIQAVLDIFFKGIEILVTTVGDICAFVFNGAKDNFGGFTSGIMSLWEEYGKPLFESIMNIIEVLKENWSTIMETCKLYFTTLMDVARTYWESIGKPMFDIIISIVKMLADTFAERMPQIISFFKGMVEDIAILWEENLKPCFDAIKAFIENVVAPAFEFVFKNIIVPCIDAAFRLIEQLWTNTLKPVFVGITDFITGVFTLNWRQAFEGLSNIVSGVFNGLISICKAPINAIIGMVNNMIGGLNKLQIPDWVPGIGGKGLSIPNIPMLAKGTDYFQGGVAIVGEEGPELVEMPTGSKVNTARETEKKLNSNMTVNIYSPKQLTPSEIARQIKNSQRRLGYSY